MKETLAKAFAFTMQDEGDYSDDAHDKGGATKYGITIGDLRAWRKRAVTKADVRALTKAEAEAIYDKWYWQAVHADELPTGVDYFLFDSGLLSGVNTARRWLQHAVGTQMDGIIGPKTLAATWALPAAETLNRLESIRRAHLKSHPDWPHFGQGWTNRVNASIKRARKLAFEAHDHLSAQSAEKAST